MMSLSFNGTTKQVTGTMHNLFQFCKLGTKHLLQICDCSCMAPTESRLIAELSANMRVQFRKYADAHGVTLPQRKSHVYRDGDHLCFDLLYGFPNVKSAIAVLSGKYKTIFALLVEDREDATWLFALIMYKLASNLKQLDLPVTVNDETMKLGMWLAAYLSLLTKDEASYAMFHDEGLDNAY